LPTLALMDEPVRASSGGASSSAWGNEVATGPVFVTSLAREIKDSPLVGRSTENRIMVRYLCRF
jgi:ATP-dependent Clp protease ATP-binding subunit ClpA